MLTTWNVATCVVTPGTRVASRKSPTTAFLNRNSNRSMAYAVIAPMITVPVIENSRMIVVLTNPRAMRPLVNAVT